jgi:hypothetical protein
MQPLEPLRVADLGLAAGDVLGVAGVDQEHLEPALIKNLINGNPTDTSRLHDHRFHPAASEPVRKTMQIAVVNVPKLRTGSGSQSGPTAAICIVAPMSMAAALGWPARIHAAVPSALLSPRCMLLR